MITSIDKLTEHGCSMDKANKVCRSRGGESCAFDGAMIVLQPIADAAHLVHGPIACCGNSWEGRGTLSSHGELHRMGFTTCLDEMDIIYGAEGKLHDAILRTAEAVAPKAIFVYATCVTGLTGEDLDAVCKKAGTKLDIPVIPVNAPGFVGPKNLGNRIAGEVLLNRVIGTGDHPNNLTPPFSSPCQGEDGWGSKGGLRSVGINLIGEYNIAGDLWLIEPVLKAAGLSILSRITGDGTFEEITYAHKSMLNVVVCGRALINVAKEMERKYGIPYVEVSFFGRTEMSNALRKMARELDASGRKPGISEIVESVIAQQEARVEERLKPYAHLTGKKALLYSGGVKSWSFISALRDLGIELVGVGTKKSSIEDEQKMRELLGDNTLLISDVAPGNLLKLLRERGADILIAGGRNQYLAVKEGYPFVDVNQERHTALAGYDGLINLAEAISNGLRFYELGRPRSASLVEDVIENKEARADVKSPLLINPLKHSQSIGAAMAFQGVHKAIPVIHGAQGCTFLGKVLLTKHFREPIALAGTKLFAEDVVLGGDENLIKTVKGFLEKNSPDLIGVLSSGLTEIKGDDIAAVVRTLDDPGSLNRVIHISTPDYEGGLEAGYAKAIEGILNLAEKDRDYCSPYALPFETVCSERETQINLLAGPHLTPADFSELREMTESFGLKAILLPDLSAVDGSRQGVSPLALGGTTMQEIRAMGSSDFTICIGSSMARPAMRLKERLGVEYRVFDGLAGLRDCDLFLELLGMLSSRAIPSKYARQRRILIDGMRDAHFFTAGKKACLALEHDHAVQTSKVLADMGMDISVADISGDLFSLEKGSDILVSSSHAEDTAKRLGVPLLQTGFPVYKVIGHTSKLSIGYRGTLTLVNEISNLLAREVEI